jgi:hypothetical protein
MFNEETDKLFYGIVESVDDPTNLGRGKVRWFIPSHVAPSTPRPTETLPWVQLALGIEFSVPPVGTIVTGYFEDGGDFQRPVVLQATQTTVWSRDEWYGGGKRIFFKVRTGYLCV